MIALVLDIQSVVLLGAGVGALGALWTFAGAGDVYRSIGRGYLDVPWDPANDAVPSSAAVGGRGGRPPGGGTRVERGMGPGDRGGDSRP